MRVIKSFNLLRCFSIDPLKWKLNERGRWTFMFTVHNMQAAEPKTKKKENMKETEIGALMTSVL